MGAFIGPNATSLLYTVPGFNARFVGSHVLARGFGVFLGAFIGPNATSLLNIVPGFNARFVGSHVFKTRIERITAIRSFASCEPFTKRPRFPDFNLRSAKIILSLSICAFVRLGNPVRIARSFAI